ncbi:MAG: hypothetical protein KDI64_20660, partial [Candidatus Accumulibacter sp.]|nr:hypothetical protein [Accumulibacter sp.]
LQPICAAPLPDSGLGVPADIAHRPALSPHCSPHSFENPGTTEAIAQAHGTTLARKWSWTRRST